MAEGYDLADLHRVSTHSLYREWSGASEEEEYRPEGGYGRMIGYLTKIGRGQGCRFHFSTTATAVRWQRGRVAVDTANGQVFEANRLIITVSLGVLKTDGLQFIPELPRQQAVIARLGFGSVIKVLLEFRKPFWGDRKKTGRTLFITSDEAAPTWWTQNADDCPLITGWIAGGPMREFSGSNGEERIDTCLRSLARLFSRDPEGLRNELKTSMILDWETAQFVRGGYSFETVGGEADRRVLADPVEDTLYFAGEAIYEGPVPGTVEAAFSSGNTVAEKIGC
jgi:monoamine oxidase